MWTSRARWRVVTRPSHYSTIARPPRRTRFSSAKPARRCCYDLRFAEAIPRLTRAAQMAADVGSQRAIATVDIAYGMALIASEDGLRRLRSALEVLRRSQDTRFLLCAYTYQRVLSYHGALEEVVQVGL